MADHQEQDSKSLGADLIIPVSAVAFTIYYISTIIDMKWEAQVSAFFVGAILVILCVIYFIKTFFDVKSGRANLSFEPLIEPLSVVPKRVALFVLTVSYIVLIEYGGFTLVTFVFLFAGMLILTEGRNKRFVGILSTILALGGYTLFVVIFKRQFPEGPFEWVVGPIVKSMLGGGSGY